MSKQQITRRKFIRSAAAGTSVALAAPTILTSLGKDSFGQEKNDRLKFALIGAGGQGSYDASRAKPFADIVAIADVDSAHAEQASKRLSDGKAKLFGDYQKLLADETIDAVIIGTPDHWHTKIAIDAMKAGKDVYCEKPLTLTIEEGKQLCKVAKETKCVFQVGTQQRSEPAHLFLKAIAIVRDGRIGDIERVTAAIGGAPTGGPFKKSTPPDQLDWDTWLGQAPKVEYISQRCHKDFRWWYEYSGGKMTDWGAHHVDIAHWVLAAVDTGPVSIEGVADHPVELKDGMPTVDDRFNTATSFMINCKMKDGVELNIRHDTDNGVLIEGNKGRIFVNRGKLVGKAVDELKENPLPEDAIAKVYNGKEPGYHMRNFVDCMKDRTQPISDVFSHHRALSTCHLANICIRLGRKLQWDPESEQIVGDDQANAFVARPQRKGFEIEV